MELHGQIRRGVSAAAALLLAAAFAGSAEAESAYVLLDREAAKGDWQPGAGLGASTILPPQAETVLEAKFSAKRGEPQVAALLDRMRRWRRVEGEPLALARLAIERPGILAYAPANLHWISSLPDDPLIAGQPYLPLIRAGEAFDLARGEDRPVLVAVVDGGTDWRHEDLRANVIERAGEIEGNGIDDDGNGFVDDVRGWNFAIDTPDPTGLPQTPENAKHGTHIAGIVAAVSDNAIGISGVSWNARILPVNVSASQASQDRTVPYAMEGLLYAALCDADIINASWGRSSQRWSDFEVDVMSLLEAADILVVAAAGNGIELQPYYPAYYPTTLSVTRVGLDRVHHFSANHDSWIDLAAPGSRILSTWPDDSYGLMDGTSQSTAVVSGTAALLLAGRPGLSTAAQLRAQLRWTASDLYDVNPDLLRELGSGMVDAEAALAAHPPGIEIGELRLLPAGGGGLPDRGELLGLYFDLNNHLAAAGAFQLLLHNRHPDLVALRDEFGISGMQAGQRLSVQPGLLLWSDDNAGASRAGQLDIVIETEARSVHQSFTVEPVPGHVLLESGELHYTHTNNGRLGYVQPLRARDPGGAGIGGGPKRSYLTFGSLLVGLGATQVADAMIAPSDPTLYRDFRPPFAGGLALNADGVSSLYTDALAAPRIGVRVEQRSIESGEANVVLSTYELSPTQSAWQGARVGLLVDFEMGRIGDPDLDRIEWIESEELLIARSESWASPQLGLLYLEGPGAAGWSWLRDLRGDESDGRPYLFDAGELAFRTTDAQLWYLLSRDEIDPLSEQGGVAAVLNSGSFDLEVGQSTRFAVAWLLGSDRAGVLAAADRARHAWSYVRAGREVPSSPRFGLLPNAPNPFNPLTLIRFQLESAQRVELTVFDARGRRVRTLLVRHLGSGYHEIPWDGRDDAGDALASGVYQVLLRGRSHDGRQSVVLIR